MKQIFDVTGMSCAACSARVDKCVSGLDGVETVSVNLLKNNMSVSYDEKLVSSDEIIAAVEKGGYGASLHSGNTAQDKKSLPDNAERQQREMLTRLIISAVFSIILSYLAMGHMLGLPLPPCFTGAENRGISAFTQLLLCLPVMAVNYRYYKNGALSLFHGAPNMDTLIAVGTGASFIYGIYAIYGMLYGYSIGNTSLAQSYGHNLYFESVGMILTLITLGKYFESRAKRKTTDAVRALMDLSPKKAVILRDGKEEEIPVSEVRTGDILVVRAGSVIPADGVIVEGSASIDESALTGESIPAEKTKGDNVTGATVSKTGYFTMRAEKIGADTALSQIIQLVDEATSSKAPVARLADKAAGIFVPIVMTISVITAVIWLILGFGADHAFTAAVSVLVISCPCALGLATPTAIMVGTGRGTAGGILIKSAESLELAHKADTVVLDKTGTLTLGQPEVTDIIPFGGIDERTLMSYAYSLERLSEHPLAQAVVRKAEIMKVPYYQVSDFTQNEGKGITGKADNAYLEAGNALSYSGKLDSKASERIAALSDEGKTPMIFTKEGCLIGIIAAADSIKPTSAEAVKELRRMGTDVIMLTGDNERTARAIGRSAGTDHIISDVLPQDKEKTIASLQNQGKCVVMVGDGINDAPALAKADIGIAIGAGTDIAIDSADIVLMKNDLYDVVNTIRLSKAVMRTIKQNLFWAFFYNIIGIPIAAGALYSFGIMLNPMIGAAAMSCSSVCVVSNALRLRHFKFRSAQGVNNIKAEKHESEETKMENKITLQIEGMMCQHCVAHVKKALEGIDGVISAQVSLEEKNAVVTTDGSVDSSALVTAVTGEGYEAKEA